MKPAKPLPRREIELPHYTYQASRDELREGHRVDATFEEVVAACLKPVKTSHVVPESRKL
ncbi:MAG: hypothetical protein OXC19_16300 [Bryobacterales bacterium]|nr:hypothetical protein [Bryobacterales bacterium]